MKMKELGPVGGGSSGTPLDPPLCLHLQVLELGIETSQIGIFTDVCKVEFAKEFQTRCF